MDKFLEAYLKRAQDVIGERSPEETAYDNEVVDALNQGRPISEALAIAAARFPTEALQWNLDTINDIAAHYEYLKEHLAIVKKLQEGK